MDQVTPVTQIGGRGLGRVFPGGDNDVEIVGQVIGDGPACLLKTAAGLIQAVQQDHQRFVRPTRASQQVMKPGQKLNLIVPQDWDRSLVVGGQLYHQMQQCDLRLRQQRAGTAGQYLPKEEGGHKPAAAVSGACPVQQCR